MEQEKLMTIQGLQEENARLKAENAQLNLSRNSLVNKNQELAEFIRTKLEDILSLAKEFRDVYGNYGEYIIELTKTELRGNTNDGESPEEGIQV